MIFDYRNKNDLKEINIHDSDFTGYNYDYSNRTIVLTCNNRFTGKCLHFQFMNVIYSSLQSCSFWGGGNAVLWLNVNERDVGLDSLYELQRKNKEEYALSDLDQGIEYIIVEVTINSGDKLLIVSQWIEFQEKAIMQTGNGTLP